jgi:hypothetical protein
MKPLALIFLLVSILSCSGTGVPDYKLEEANRARTNKQKYIEDSAEVFFTDYPNPFYNMSFLAFSCFKEGSVELAVFDGVTDTLEAVYTFAGNRRTHSYDIDFPRITPGAVRCVIRVDGREKCSRPYRRWDSTLNKEGDFTVRRK